MSEAKILLVQDEKSPLAALRQALSKRGYNVTTCGTAFDALDEMRTEPGDLVLACVNLPDVSGFQLATLIKSHEHTNSIPVVLVGDSDELDNGFWQRAASSDLVLDRKEAESAADKTVERVKQLLANAHGTHKQWLTDSPLIPSNFDSKNLLHSYKALVANLLIERNVSHLARCLVESVSSRVQFMARFSGYMQRIFNADITGLIVIDPKSHWAIYDVLSPVSKSALEKLQTTAAKAINVEEEIRTVVNGDPGSKEGGKGGAALKAHEVIPVHDSHNDLLGAVVLGWTGKPALDDQQKTIFEMLKMHMRPVFKALFDLQQIQMLKQHHAFGSYVDPITGLYNIEFLIGFLQQQLLFSSRQKLPTGLILIDIDQFVEINEQYGAETGDMVLMSIGHKFSRSIRQSDLLARYSGDTFAIVLPNTDMQGAKTLAEKLRSEVQAMSWDIVGNKQLQVTVCVGCAAFNFSDCNPETILRDAKIALMDAKETGANRVSP